MPKATASSQPEKPSDGVALKLRRLEREVLAVPIVGTTPLIIHKWAEKSIRMLIEGKGTRGVKKKRVLDAREPEEEFNAARYLLQQPRADGFTDGLPAVAFKAAIVQAARAFEGATMTMLKQFIFVEGEAPDMLVPIGGKAELREDMVRIGSGMSKVADVRWRPMYWPWRTELRIHYSPSIIDAESILALVDAAGQGGVGEWRPTAPQSFTGMYGQFEVDLTP